MTIYEIVQTALLILIALSIIAQLPFTHYIFISASKLTNDTAKKIQAGAFCLIASLAIFLFIWIGEMWLAFFAAIIEATFNIYYYTEDYWKSPYGMKTTKNDDANKKSVKRLWRRRWILFFISVIVPAFMFIFGFLLKNLDQYL
jgi:hypothetical protein